MQEYIRCGVPHLKFHNQLTTDVKKKKTQKKPSNNKMFIVNLFMHLYRIYHYYFANIQMSNIIFV